MQFSRWTIGPTLAYYLTELLRPGMRTLECGSGLSTAIFLDAGCDHIALENESRYAFQHPCVIVTSLTGTPPWYSVWPRGPFDVILIDGPAAATGGRWGFMRAAGDLIGQNTVVIIDDVNRRDENALASAIARAFGLTTLEVTAKHPKDYARRARILLPSELAQGASSEC